jgi:uncharacterized protein YbjT (DUF2867 family)
MKDKKIILVTGIQGKLGRNVAASLLVQNKFSVRALTENLRYEEAISLQQKGAILVEGSLSNKDSLRNAMQDCHGVFGITGFSEPVDNEYALGKNLADVVKEMEIRHFIFSSLDDYTSLSNGSFSLPHFEVKAALKRYIKALDIPASFVQVSTSYDSFLHLFPIQKDENNELYFALPQGNVPFATMNTGDYGPIVATIFNYPVEYIGRTVRAVGAFKTGHGYSEVLSKVLERKIRYKHISSLQFAASGFAEAAEMANMFEFQRLFAPERQIDLIESYGLNANMVTFENWVNQNKFRFEMHLAALLHTPVSKVA